MSSTLKVSGNKVVLIFYWRPTNRDIHSFFIRMWFFGFRLKISKKITISASKNFLFLTFSQAQKLLNFSNFLPHISTPSKMYTLNTYVFENLIVWCISFSPIITKISILKENFLCNHTDLFFNVCKIQAQIFLN